LETLRAFGLDDARHVLEIGAGCLGLAAELCELLPRGGYVGIEPNASVSWSGLQVGDRGDLFRRKRGRLLDRSDFDPSAARRKFDLVFAHSVLSHGALSDPAKLLRNVGPHLAPGAPVVTSLRLGQVTTAATSWTWPQAVAFSLSDLVSAAESEGFTVEHRPEIRERCVATLPRMFHDWVVWRASA